MTAGRFIVDCPCGITTRSDGDFLHFVECRGCHRVYNMGGRGPVVPEPLGVAGLVAENNRLRGLVVLAEWQNHQCPWCMAFHDDGHESDCPAFGDAAQEYE